MTQPTKLKIIGEYTPEHPGPFCTRDGQAVRLLTKTEGSEKFPIVGFIGAQETPTVWGDDGGFFGKGTRDNDDIMNAREVPVAREFWVNEYKHGLGAIYESPDTAQAYMHSRNFIRTIHVREVLPGEGE